MLLLPELCSYIFVQISGQIHLEIIIKELAMKEVTLKIPDKKLSFFMELIEHLGFEITKEIEIPEEHKTIVRERIKKSRQNPGRLVDWEKVQDNFKFD